MIYFGCFLLSVLTCQWALQVKGNRFQFCLLMALSALFPVLLAGLRATSVGTDVSYYLVADFRLAGLRASFIKYVTSYASSREPLYMLIVYFVKKTFDNINVVMFIFQLIIIVGIYIGLYKHRSIISVPFALSIFLFLFYNETLNLMRQWMALAIVFAGVDNVENGRYKKFILYVAVATLFHTTALIALVLMPLHYILTHEMYGQRTMIKLFFMLIVLAICLFADQLIRIIINMGILPSKYMRYVNDSSVSGRNIDTLLTLAEIALLLFYNKRLTKRVPHYTFYKYNAYLYLLAMQLARIMFYGDRFAATFRLVNVLTIAILPQLSSDRKTQQLMRIGIMVMCFIYWWYMYIYIGYAQTYPYLFA